MTHDQPRTAFLNLYLGGTGQRAGQHLTQLNQADQTSLISLQVYMDTERQPTPFVDRTIFLSLDREKLEVLRADPASFGPLAELIVAHYPRLLNPEDVGNGARTIRLLTQLSFTYHREAILRELRGCLLDLVRRGGFDAIIPVMLSSSGGGTGSALQVLLPQALKDPGFHSRLTEGLPAGLVQTPIAFVIEPYAYALVHRQMHADKVLANAFAFRRESDELMNSSAAYKYIFHLGLANQHGAVLDTPEEVARVLGTAVYQFERHWPQIKAQFVDTIDTHALTAGYTGHDLPEHVLSTLAPRSAEAPVTGNGKPTH